MAENMARKGKMAALSLLQKMQAGGESIDLIDMGVVQKMKQGSELPKKTFGGRTDGSRTYSGRCKECK